jgi:hypothetical protein
MILKKIKKAIIEFRENNNTLKSQNEFIINQNAELEWAHIYNDTIRGRKWLEDSSISPGRWAANYSFLYILIRILSDCKPKKIIELGLGESSKIISSFLKHELHESTHLIIEHNNEWIKLYGSTFSISQNSNILHLESEIKIVNGFPVNSYKQINEAIDETFDLYIIDGPHGSDRYSRYDICSLLEKMNCKSEFILVFDDYHRVGEQDTVNDTIKILNKIGIKNYTGEFAGNKSQIVIATEKYKYTVSL